MKKVLLIITIAVMAAGCHGRDGQDGRNGNDGSVNMAVRTYDIASNHWIFDPGVGPDGLGRHYFYPIDREFDNQLGFYLNSHTFDNGMVMVQRVMQVQDNSGRWVTVITPLNHVALVEEQFQNGDIEGHTEVLAYDYSYDPPAIYIYYHDSRFLDMDEYRPVSMTFRVVFMWP